MTLLLFLVIGLLFLSNALWMYKVVSLTGVPTSSFYFVVWALAGLMAVVLLSAVAVVLLGWALYITAILSGLVVHFLWWSTK